MQQILRKNIYPLVFLFAGIAFVFVSEWIYDKKYLAVDIEARVSDFNKKFLDNKQKAFDNLLSLTENFKNSEKGIFKDLKLIEHLAKKYDNYGLVFMVSEDNHAVFWSENSLTFHELTGIDEDEGLLELQNGWHYYIRQSRDNYDFWAFMLLKRDYNYQNRFLRNTYHMKYEMMPEPVVPSIEETDYQVFDKEGENILFYFSKDEKSDILYKSIPLYRLALLFAISALFLIFYSIYHFVFKIYYYEKRKFFPACLIFIMLIIFARTIFYFYGIASSLSDSELFSPSLYAAAYYLPSLGDLFLNVILIFWITWIINLKIQDVKLKTLDSGWKKISVGVAATGIIGLAGYGIYELIKGLVINSKLNLNVNFVFSLDYYSIIGFLIIGFILFAFYFFSRTVLWYVKAVIKPVQYMYTVIFSSFLILLALTFPVNIQYPLSLAGFVLLLMLLIINEKITEDKQLKFSNLILYIFVFSMISTTALYGFNEIKERNERKSLALKLSSDQDPIAEYLFLENENDLLKDKYLKEIIYDDPYNEYDVYNYLKANYFYDYWLKYDMQITICHPDDILLIKPSNIEVECGYFFDDYIKSFGKSTDSEYLFYLENNTGRDSYIVRLPIFFQNDHLQKYPEKSPDYYVYVEFDSKYIPRDMGFPELLLDESVDIKRELINYSFAFYKFGELTHRVGNYFFNNKSAAYGDFKKEFTFFEKENFHHLNYQKDEETQIIISREKDGFFEIIAPFSYLFILFFLMVLVFWIILHAWKGDFRLKFNFKRRVQFSMVLIVILSGIIIGWASVWFLLNVHENKSLNIVSEKAYSILVEMENNLGEEPYLDYQYEYYLSDQLLKLSNVFFTDINLFDPGGNLLASSRSRIYDEGLVSSLMDPVALGTMKDRNKSFFIHNEHIGRLQFLSAYIPLKNFENDLLAYINLPYFAREREMQYEISTFLVAFMNIYLLLLVMAIVVAFFISNYVTRPLQLIRESLSRIKLGRTNMKIEWSRNDEIGNLVREYNRMIDELEISAELLAKNERESAWREMAKQVAHEIKNPLTPMKLSVQYLHKAWKDRVEDWEERLEGFTKTMVEQIDSLSLIASEFSDFAKLPSNNNSWIELNSFIPEIVELYKDFEKVKINLNIDEQKMTIYADPKQMLRVFNNLLKNAIQSYEKDQTAHITIDCFKEEDHAVICIKDKGCGITDSQKDKIFKPYFTTKTGGLGLGLAMVKNIIEGFDGTISFESQANKGSTFIIRMPLVNYEKE